MKLRMTARCASAPAGEGITPERTPLSWPDGSTYGRCTSTCGVWAYESKNPGLSSTSSPKTNLMRDMWSSCFESWQVFGQRYVLRRRSCGRGGDHHCRAAARLSCPWLWSRAKSIGHRRRVRRGALRDG